MRMLLVSDLHYSLRQLDWVMSVASDYDLVADERASANERRGPRVT